MNSVQSDGIGGCRLTSSFCNYKMLTIFFHRIHYIWSSCSCTWIKTWTKSALGKESHKYTTKKQTVAAMKLATQNPQKNSSTYIPIWGYSFFLELGSGGYGQGYMFREWGGPGTRREPSVWPEFPELPHLRLLAGIKIRKNLMFQTDGFDWISEERRHLMLKVSPLLRQKLFWEQDALHMHWKNSSASSLHNSHHPHAAIEYKHWDSVPRFCSCNSLNTLRDQIRVFTLSTPNKVLRLNPNILHLMLSGLLWENHTRR
jgi:hypothetical protein